MSKQFCNSVIPSGKNVGCSSSRVEPHRDLIGPNQSMTNEFKRKIWPNSRSKVVSTLKIAMANFCKTFGAVQNFPDWSGLGR